MRSDIAMASRFRNLRLRRTACSLFETRQR